MIALDASILIGHFNSRDPHHHEATAILGQARKGELFIHALNLAEVFVGAIKVGRGEAMRAAVNAMGITIVELSAEHAITLAQIRAETGLKLPDCCVLLAAHCKGARVATFDRQLADVAQARGITVVAN